MKDHYCFTYEVNSNGIRLDSFLKKHYQRRSREKLKQAIYSGKVSVQRNSRSYLPLGRLKPSLQLLLGDQVQVFREKKNEPEVCFNYRILYEDESLLVIDKPAHLPVHPAGDYFFNTLLVDLRRSGRVPTLQPGKEYFLVHRIDKETSGILVLAKSRNVCAHLTHQFAQRSIEKLYLAIVEGNPPLDFIMDIPVKKASHSLIYMKMQTAPESEGGLPAFTSFHKKSVYATRLGVFSLLECVPRTGRQHQIRVHLEAAGFPIVGDKLYGLPEQEALQYYERRSLSAEAWAKLRLSRHALHAARICLEHPQMGQRLGFSSEFPEDLRRFLEPEQ